jgi:hypothetical protein
LADARRRWLRVKQKSNLDLHRAGVTMPQPNVTVSPNVPGETIDYKPLSLLAVAGLLVAALFTVLLVVGAVAAQVKGEPYLEPILVGTWAFALPIVGAALSGLALWQIYNSEETKAGAKLAKWGLGLSLITGLGYFTYQSVTELAVVQQANRFLMEKDEGSGFFPRLQGTAADVRTAYLYTLNIADRNVRIDSPEDIKRLDLPTPNNPKGLLTQFLESPLVQALEIAQPGTVKVEPLAVRGWTFEGRSYHVARLYRITTDEAVYEVPLTVSSIEPIGEGEKRKWRVDWDKQPGTALQPISRTDLGYKRSSLRRQAQEFLSDSKSGLRDKVLDAVKTKLPPNRLLRLVHRVVPDDMAKCTISDNGEVLVTYQVEAFPSVEYGGQRKEPDILLLLNAIAAAKPAPNPSEAKQWYLKSVDYVRSIPIPQQQK